MFCPATDDETLKCENCKHSKIVHKIYPRNHRQTVIELTVLANQIVNFDKNIVSVDELKDSVLDALIVSKALAKTRRSISKRHSPRDYGGGAMKSEQEIREHIRNLEKMLLNPLYSDDTKRLFLVEKYKC